MTTFDMFRCIVLCSILLRVSAVSVVRREQVQAISHADDCSFECHIVRPEILSEEGEQEQEGDLACLTQLPGRSYRSSLGIELPPTFLNDHRHAIASGRLHLCISSASIENGNIVLSQDTELTVLESDRRRLQVAKAGRKRLLAVRVSTPSGEEPDESAELIEGTIFGTGARSVTPSVVGQYLDISHNQLLYVPAVGQNIENGVLEIKLKTHTISGKNIQGSLTDDLLNRTEEAIGPIGNSVDNIIFCLPTGSSFQKNEKWTAFTYLFEPYSYYQQSRCTRLSVAVHELGHSLGFQHSGVLDNIYADKTGYMGYAVNKVGHPRKAFNGHKHWLSGWFQDRARLVNPRLEGAGIRLVSFVDYSNPSLRSDDQILVRAGNMFIQYNLAESYNEDTDEPNTVTITEAVGREEVSLRLAALRSGESYFVPGQGAGNFVIQVCSTQNTASAPASAFISIHQDGDESFCSQEAEATNSNVAATGRTWDSVAQLLPPPPPVSAPTRAPISSPSSSPFAAPTIILALSPVPANFRRPSPQPIALNPEDESPTNMPTFSARNVAVSNNGGKEKRLGWTSSLILIPVTAASGAFVCFCLVLGVFLRFFACKCKGGGSGSSQKTDKNSSSSGSDDTRQQEGQSSSIEDDLSDSESTDWWMRGDCGLSEVGCGGPQ